MTTVVVAEKPSVGRDIAQVLGANQRRDGFLQGNGYIVTWAIGHLVHFAEPNDYGESWDGRWSYAQLPILPERWRLRTHKKTVKQFRIVKKLITDPSTRGLICATDAGREGEHIFRLIMEHARSRKTWQRLWISSLTTEAIKEGFKRLQPGSAYDALGQAARARAQADWLMGMNLTRVYTVRHGALYTIGRVQTPTLAMIVKRERQIREFTKAYYYEIVAALQEGFEAKLEHEAKTRIEKKAEAERLFAGLRSQQTGTITELSSKNKRLRPPPLYDLTTLQRDANRRLGLTAAQTLQHAQTLYEKFKLISYPRTESRHISEDMVPRLPRILENIDHPQAANALERLRGGHRLSKAYVDRTKLSDHHGILPTGRRPPGDLSKPLRGVFDLIAARFVGIFLPDHLTKETKARLRIGDGHFVANGVETIEEGWKVVEPRPKKARKALPTLEKGQIVHVKDMQLLEKETEPPKRYTDATLLDAMKKAGRAVEDEALAEAMKDSGLGTPATRAEIIEKLIRARYVARKRKVLEPTEKGMALVSVAAEPLISVETTGVWEQRLRRIQEGEEPAKHFYRDIVSFVEENIALAREKPRLQIKDSKKPSKSSPRKPSNKAKTETPRTGPKTLGVCPKCGEGQIIQGNQAYGCTRYRLGCRFLVDKEVSGKKITPRQIQALLAKGRTNRIKGFQSPGGNHFSARLALDQDKKPTFEDVQLKDETAESLITPEGHPCLLCGKGTIIKGRKGYGCSRWREGCGFAVFPEIAGKKLTAKQLLMLVSKGKTATMRGFRDPGGTRYAARLEIGPEGKVLVKRS